MDPDGRGGGEELRGVEAGGETDGEVLWRREIHFQLKKNGLQKKKEKDKKSGPYRLTLQDSIQ